jgi:hypothetical protein
VCALAGPSADGGDAVAKLEQALARARKDVDTYTKEVRSVSQLSGEV